MYWRELKVGFFVGVGNEVVDVCIIKIIIEIEFLLSDVLSDLCCKKNNFVLILICFVEV